VSDIDIESDEISRSDLALIARAVRQDWRIPPDRCERLLARLVDYLDTTTDEGRTAPDRIVIGAARAVAAFMALNIKQQMIDLMRQRMEGKPAEFTAADYVQAAEQRAEERKRELSG
jgi:hypothetical protein